MQFVPTAAPSFKVTLHATLVEVRGYLAMSRGELGQAGLLDRRAWVGAAQLRIFSVVLSASSERVAFWPSGRPSLTSQTTVEINGSLHMSLGGLYQSGILTAGGATPITVAIV
jgi:hypothetical protein